MAAYRNKIMRKQEVSKMTLLVFALLIALNLQANNEYPEKSKQTENAGSEISVSNKKLMIYFLNYIIY